MVISVADRYETIATAIAASYTNIPLVHVQGGEVTGSVDEKVRHAVTKLSNLHFVANQQAAERLTKMGEVEESIFVTGCPSVDLARVVKEGHTGPFDPFLKYAGVGSEFDASEGYIVVMQHPTTTEYDQSHEQIIETMEAVDSLDKHAFFFWPNVDAGSDLISKGIRQYREFDRLKRVYFYKNMSPEDFLRLLIGAECIVGNSSVGIRECAYLGVPTVNIGARQNRRDRAENVLDVEHDRQAIADAIRSQCEHGPYRSSHLYGDGLAGPRIADKLASVDLRIDKTLTY
jgi:UDP-hydrolysing UDP-N-acetyl-D-glucosamine 2-epimerase